MTVKNTTKNDNKVKLISAICMLVIASIMVVTSTYAWVVLSTAPEVTEITTTVGANGALEIRLNIDDNDDKNSQFRNIVDFTNSKYGLDKIVLLPSIVAPSANLLNEVLQIPEYGDDGLATGQGMPNKTVIGSWETDGYFYKSDVTGVRAVGAVSNMTDRQVRFDDAIAAARNALAAAKSNATTSLKNDAFVGIVIKMMTNGDGGYEQDDVEALGTIITKLEASVKNMKEAYKQMIIAAAASDNGQDDILSDLVVNSWGSETLTLEAIASTGVIAIGNYSYNAPDEILEGISSVLAIGQTVATAKNSYDNLNGDYSTANVNPIITTLVNKGNVLVNGVDPSEVNYTDIMLNGATITMLPGAGVYVQIADQVGDFSAQITKTISMKTQSDVAEKYIPTAIAALQTKGAPGGEIEDLPMTALYGYIIDLGFKTNAQNSSLLLQTEAIDRIDNDNPTDGTMGGGSYMSFSKVDGADISNDKVIEIMKCFRIVFFDTNSGEVLGYASLNTANATVDANNEVTAKIYMDNDDQVITALAQNTECNVSVLVYLDAQYLKNEHVSATTAQSITGVMNLQFASDADLIPMPYGK